MKELTICIPTYNRKERLLAQLSSLYEQEKIEEVDILVIDNHSDYDVKTAIEEHLGKDRVSNLTVYSNDVNIGLEPNICMPFFLAKTKWIWTLGDDDVTLPNSLNIVLSDIESHPDYASFIYSINGFTSHQDKTHVDITAFIEYLLTNKTHPGDLVFLSTKVYNLEILGKYKGRALRECMNCAGHIVPILYCLDAKDGCVATRNCEIVKYKLPAKGSGWNISKIAYEFSLFSYLELNVNKSTWKSFCGFIGKSIAGTNLLVSFLNYKPKYKGRFYFHEVYDKLLVHGGIRNLVYFWIFEFCYFFNIDLRKIVESVRRRRGE